jgi:hypothetical protein
MAVMRIDYARKKLVIRMNETITEDPKEGHL